MWRLPQAGTLAVLKLPATLLLITLALMGIGTLLSAGGLTVLTVHPTRTVTPSPTDTDTTSSPPTSPPTTPPTSPATSPPTSPPSAPATPGPASGPLAQDTQQVMVNSAALLTTWIGLISQVLALLTAMIGLATAGRRPATAEPTDSDGPESPRDRRPRHR
ncbi:hypothetical protein GCM10017744_104420 [Streptomyces antimycoticus]|uniref:Uncharacterized protein n=1 Tax=Streptomyces antimycoticus TaxID=68175 RepID=A0A4D4KJN8_9ACTN|nr:hypothetical protein [Streptomyces antimycoticus]GDY49165.1 hypothetical protein SANT12839_100470 [Streptomyces antimycoticus]